MPVPGQRVRFDTAAEGVSVEVTAEGVTVSGDEQAPGGRRRLMQAGGGDSGTATGTVGADSTTNKFYLAPNRVTVLCPDADLGETGMIGGVTYTKRDGDGLRKLVESANEGALVTSCTTGVTDMSLMFNVRTPPSRVLLFFCRRDGGGGRHPSPRSEIAPHSTRPPVPRCAVERQGLQSGHR
jgi:hypothetical protein